MLWNYFGITTQSGYTDDDDTTGYTIDDDAYHYYGSQASSPSAPSSPLARSMAIKITSTITRPLVQALKNNIPGVSPLGSSPRQNDEVASLSSSPDTQITFTSTSSPTLAGDIDNHHNNNKSSTSEAEKKAEDSYWALYSSVGGTADSTVPSPPPERRELKLFNNNKEDYDAFGKAIPVSTFDSVALDPEAEDPTEDFIRRVEEERSERWSSASSSSSSAASTSASSRKGSRSRSVGGKAKPSSSLERVQEPELDSEFDSDPFGRGFEDAFDRSSDNSPAKAFPPKEDSLGLSFGPLPPTTTSRSSREDMAYRLRGIYDEWVQQTSSPSEDSFIAFVRESLASHHL